MNRDYTVMLMDGTVGRVDCYSIDGDIEGFVGQELNVHLHDEDGNPIEKSGIVKEVL